MNEIQNTNVHKTITHNTPYTYTYTYTLCNAVCSVCVFDMCVYCMPYARVLPYCLITTVYIFICYII